MVMKEHCVEVSALGYMFLTIPSPCLYYTQFTSPFTSGNFLLSRLHLIIELQYTIDYRLELV